MKLDATNIVTLLGVLLCNDAMLKWLETEAAKTETPIDDITLKVIKKYLCFK